MEAQDVLADEVEALGTVARPVLLILRTVVGIAERGDVVRERVDPDVEHVVRPLRDRDPPLHAGAAHAEVLEPLVDDAEDLVAPRFGIDAKPARRGALRDRLAQPALVGGETEEEVLLLGPLARALVDGAQVARLLQLVLVLEGLAPRAVPPGVRALVDRIAAVGALRLDQPAPQLQHAAHVQVLRGADEAVVADIEPVPELAEDGRDLIAVLLGGNALLAGDPLDVLAVLVGAGEEECVLALQPPGPGQRIGRDRRVRVPHVGNVVDVVDRCREKPGPALGHEGLGWRVRYAATAAAHTSLTATPRAAAARWQSSNSGCAL